MPLVKVYNDNVYEHRETFKGTPIVIPAGGHIEMEYEEGIEFKGQFTGVAPLGEDGGPNPKFYKMIRVEQPPPESLFQDDGLTNHLTGKRASSADDLLGQLLVLARNKPDLVVKDPALDKSTDRIAELEAKIERLTALVGGEVEKRGPGRPKKEASL